MAFEAGFHMLAFTLLRKFTSVEFRHTEMHKAESLTVIQFVSETKVTSLCWRPDGRLWQ